MTDPSHFTDTAISFHSNLIAHLPDNAFQNFPNVESIDLHGNKILNGKSFKLQEYATTVFNYQIVWLMPPKKPSKTKDANQSSKMSLIN